MTRDNVAVAGFKIPQRQARGLGWWEKAGTWLTGGNEDFDAVVHAD